MTIVQQIIYLLQFLLVQVLRGMLTLLPLRCVLFLAQCVGSVYYALDHEHRKIGLINLRRAYGASMSLHNAQRTLRRAYQQLVMSVAEMVVFPRLLRSGAWKQYLRFEDHSALDRARLERTGFLMVTAHIGNWELGAVGLTLFGFPITTIVKPLKNPYLERMFLQWRKQTGQRIVHKEGAYRTIVKTLEENKPVALMLDQNAKEEGLFVDFFDRPASTLELPAKLALRFHLPIVLVYIYRTSDPCRHVVVAAECLFPEEGKGIWQDSRMLTTYLTKRLEDFIRLYPDQWLWMYRRWLHRPDGTLENYERPLEHYWRSLGGEK